MRNKYRGQEQLRCVPHPEAQRNSDWKPNIRYTNKILILLFESGERLSVGVGVVWMMGSYNNTSLSFKLFTSSLDTEH